MTQSTASRLAQISDMLESTLQTLREAGPLYHSVGPVSRDPYYCVGQLRGAMEHAFYQQNPYYWVGRLQGAMEHALSLVSMELREAEGNEE